MGDILNLDALVSPRRVIRIGGVEYEVREPRVSEMPAVFGIVQKYRLDSGEIGEEQVNGLLELLRLLVPGLPEEVARGLTVRQMVALQRVLTEVISPVEQGEF